MYSVVYLPGAKRQLEAAVLYIAEEFGSPDAAGNLLDQVDEAATSLAEMPYRYPIYPTLYAMKNEIRFVPVMNYLLFFTVKEESKTVEVWRFLHQRQNDLRP